MRCDTAGCVVLSFSDAARKLPSVATQKKVSMLRNSIMALFPRRDERIMSAARRYPGTGPQNKEFSDDPGR
ncbi:hypothetical protein D9M68_968890 [compost metagenome]